MRTWLLLLLATVIFAQSAAADSKMYLDDSGNIHFVRSIQNVPEKYRDQLAPPDKLQPPRFKQDVAKAKSARKKLAAQKLKEDRKKAREKAKKDKLESRQIKKAKKNKKPKTKKEKVKKRLKAEEEQRASDALISGDEDESESSTEE